MSRLQGNFTVVVTILTLKGPVSIAEDAIGALMSSIIIANGSITTSERPIISSFFYFTQKAHY